MNETALRRMVAQMPTMAESDFDSILAELNPSQRQRVVGMLADFQPSEVRDEAEADFLPVLVPPDLSPWLVARVNGLADSGEETMDHFTITPHSARILRECAATMMPQPSGRVPSHSLLVRAWQRLAGASA
jgi:hypothetical protein